MSNKFWSLAIIGFECNDSHYMTTYGFHELVLVTEDTYKYLNVKTDTVKPQFKGTRGFF